MGQLVLAYHGCDISTRDALVRGDLKQLDQSVNRYDWLGNGIYMFLEDPERALKLATFASENPNKLLTKRPIVIPAVVGSILDIDRWLDLSTENGRQNFRAGAKVVKEAAKAASQEGPQNRAAFPGDVDMLHRAFDCSVCNIIHSLREETHREAISKGDTKLIYETLPYQATRSIFEQGESVEGSCIYDGSHTQIAVRDANCIKGWFLVRGDNLLGDSDYQNAKDQIAIAIQNRRDSKTRTKTIK